MTPAPIPEKKILDDIRAVAESLGRAPTSSEYGEHGEYSRTTPCDKFGTWNEAKQAAGIETYEEGSAAEFTDEFVVPESNPIPENKLKEDLKRVAGEVGRQPTADEYRELGEYAVCTFTRRWGSWQEAKAAAGLESEYICPGNRRGTRDELLDEIHRLRDHLGRVPIRDDLSDSEFSPKPFQREFGSWNEAIREAGYEPNHRINIPREEIRNAIQSLADELGRTPSREEFAEKAGYSKTLLNDRFESWEAACESVNLTSPTRFNIPRSELIDSIQSWADKNGKPPTANDMEAKGPFSLSAFYSTLDSWARALAAAGYEERYPVGEDHPTWRGGKPNSRPYSSNWESVRDDVIERDDEQCLDCEMSRTEHRERFGRDLNVHHRHPARTFDDIHAAEELSNLFTVCMKCHPRWERLIPFRPRVI